MIVAQEKGFIKARVEFGKLIEKLEQKVAEGNEIDNAERDIYWDLLALGRILLQGYIDEQGSGDLGVTVEHEGLSLKRLPNLHDRRYVSVFGEITVSRAVYGTRETQKHEVVPLDARLNLPQSDFSYFLQELDQAQVVRNSYSESRSTMEQILGIHQSVGSLEKMNVSMSESVESFRESQPVPEASDEGPILVFTADCKGVPIRRAKGESKPEGRLKKGQKPGKKRMACVGAVYTIDPFERDADDVVDEVFREEAQKDRPKPRHKQVRAELSREVDGEEFNAKEEIFKWFGDQLSARDPYENKQVVCLMDGERALWKQALLFFPFVICILDIYHVLERLWQAAYCFHPEGSDEAKEFVQVRLSRILEGDLGYVIGGLKQMQTKLKLVGSKKKNLTSVITYLENNRDYMRYDSYLSAGYPIGSGVAEGACRYVVKDRMELTGMRWRVEGAQSMLSLRAIYINGDWTSFQRHRIEKERARLYPYRVEIESNWRAAA